jgi:hypothetical protein
MPPGPLSTSAQWRQDLSVANFLVKADEIASTQKRASLMAKQ